MEDILLLAELARELDKLKTSLCISILMKLRFLELKIAEIMNMRDQRSITQEI